MYNYNEGNTTPRLLGGVFTLLYLLSFSALMLWGGVTIESEEVGQGIVVDFGTTLESGSGEEDTSLADDYSLPEPTATPKSEPVQTQQVEESPTMEEANIVTDTQAPEVEQKEVEETPPTEEPKPREVNRRALFPGNTPNSEAPSEGTTDKAEGNQGYIGGTKADTYEGTGGEGGFEPDWNLKGRRPRNEFPRPAYNGHDQGIVVVDIWVDGNGDVTGAAYNPKGSTVAATSPLVTEAIKAAKGVKFDQSEQDLQIGYITYSFRLDTKGRR